MTRQEFDRWIEQHYTELLGVARRRVNRDAEDVLQTAVVSMLTNLAVKPEQMGVWPWAVACVRRAAGHYRESEKGRLGGISRSRRRANKASASAASLRREKKMPKLFAAQKGTQAADNYYLERLEEDRADFDMEGRGRAKGDPAVSVRLPFEGGQ
ncbi:MAG: hypothetical protein A3E78_02495 [Alphaproteobacteria bacterium RIFCSPHIGHO2_12_FULL_63_12]|nr:MAG: hypothetical protein A3E78_02495 [Alphaproteobacteria bacterium RIFCSPHIGHO2_12_FULL_63_12]